MPENTNNKISCPICKENKYIDNEKILSSIYSSNFYQLATCKRCHHFFISNPADVGNLNGIYKILYKYEAHLAIGNEKKWRANKTIQNIIEFIPINTLIVDIGCSFGFYLEAFRKFGYQNLMGIEIDEAAVMKCREKGFNAFQGTFSQWLFTESRKLNTEQTCIILFHVLEHIQNLDMFFEEIKTVLKSGNYLIILLPNSESRTNKLFRKYWGWWQVPVHLHHFTIDSLSKLLSAKGFNIEKNVKRGADSLFWLSSLASFIGMKSKKRSILSIQKLIIQCVSFIIKYWYFIGDEELLLVAKNK